MKRVFAWLTAATLATAVAATATVAVANEDYINHRKALMRANGTVLGLVGKMAQGAIEYDQAAAIGALEQLEQTGSVLPRFFPDGSGEGDTRAGDAIFSDRDGFVARATQLATDARAAITATEADGLEGLQASLGAVGGNCQACHSNYRN